MPAREVSIRPGARSDLPAIVAIYNHYVEHEPTTFEVTPVGVEAREGWFRDHSAGGRHRLYVAADPGGEVVGWSTSSTFRERAAYATTVEASIYLRRDIVGQGVGARLYATLFESLQGEDIERIVAGVTLPNPGSLALHAKFGFQPVGTFTRVGRKFGRFWDVAWFERPLRRPAPAQEGAAAPSSP